MPAGLNRAFLALGSLVWAPSVVAQELPDLTELLAPRVVEAEVLEPALHPEAQELLDKMAEANRDNLNWLMQYLAGAQSGRPLLDEAKLGVTRSELERYRVLADSGSIRVARRVRLEHLQGHRVAARIGATRVRHGYTRSAHRATSRAKTLST